MARILLLVPLVAIAAGLGYLANASGQGAIAIDETSFFPQKVLRVEYAPHPRDIVNLRSGVPYTVPAGKLLVIQDWSSEVAFNTGADLLSILVDGSAVWGVRVEDGQERSGSLSVGVVVRGGHTVELESVRAPAYIAGFLADP